MNETKTRNRKSKLKTKIFLGLGSAIILFIIFLGGMIVEDVPADKIIINQVPITGTLEYWTEPGLEWQMFGTTKVYDKTTQVWFSDRKDEGGEVNEAIKIVFNDAGVGYVSGSGRVVMPRDEHHLKRIREDYQSMDALFYELIYPTIRKVIFSSGPLMNSFESYAAKKNDLIRYIEDQLEYGVYKTKSQDKKTIDPISGEEKVVAVADVIKDPASPGGYKRQEESPFAYYGITVKPITVSGIKYEQKIIDQIDEQQKAFMGVQTAKADALKAKQVTIKREEEGKANAAEAKWKQEVIKAKEVTLAEQKFAVAELAAKEALEYKKKVIAEGQAEAEKNRLKVAAGLTPQERAEWKFKTAVGVAEKMSQLKLPTTMVFGASGGKGGSPLNPFDAVGLKTFMDINKTIVNQSTTK